MSRIIIERYEDGEEHIVAGWDNPMKSYFFQVYRPKSDPLRDEDQCSLRLGYLFKEFPQIGDLKHAITVSDYEGVLTDQVTDFLRVSSAMPQNTIIDLTDDDVRASYNGWRPLVQVSGEDKWSGNGLVFATKKEAEQSAYNLGMRWTLVMNTSAGPAQGDINASVRADGTEGPA